MSSPINGAQNEPPSIGIWPKIGPYVIPPIAASGAIVFPFSHLIAKSMQQKGQSRDTLVSQYENIRKGYKRFGRVYAVLRARTSRSNVIESHFSKHNPIWKGYKAGWVKYTSSKSIYIPIKMGLKEGFNAAPKLGGIVGAQMILQNGVETYLVGDSKKPTLTDTFISAGIVGFVSSPFLAIFNGQTINLTWKQSALKYLRKPRQALAITGQETGFIFGFCAADRISMIMKSYFGDNKAVDYSGAYISGALGSIAGHPFNTAVTRWQADLEIDVPSKLNRKEFIDMMRQLMRGAARRAHGIGIFAVCYKFAKEKMK